MAGLGVPYVPAGDMLGNSMVSMNLQLCPPSSLRLGTGQRMPPLSQGSLPTGWILAAAIKVLLGEKLQASGSGPACQGWFPYPYPALFQHWQMLTSKTFPV